MAASYFFYDLETSGFSPREARVMQFAGQRTDFNLEPVGEPINVLIKLSPDILPDPDAVLLTGITPQATLQEGLTEAQFLKYFYDEVVQPDITFLGYNSIRFDDEFMRFLHYRNFYDPYEWQWTNGCSRWDVLDLVRMTRALRPEGIEWPVTDEGKPTNRLELLTKSNKLAHEHAHDALSDVRATIAVTKMIRDKQPDLYAYLFEARNKKKVSELVLANNPFVYTSGRYPSDVLHTSAAIFLVKHPQQDCALVYDLRHDPRPFMAMSVDELVACWKHNKDPKAVRLPVKTLKYNRCPAVAPLGVISKPEVQARLQLNVDTITQNLAILKKGQAMFAHNILEALKKLDGDRDKATAKEPNPAGVDGQLYEGFFAPGDKQTMAAIRSGNGKELNDYTDKLQDQRLRGLLPLYKARNFPGSLSSDERAIWDGFISQKLFANGPASRLNQYFGRLQVLAKGELTSDQEYLLAELQLYGESIIPTD